MHGRAPARGDKGTGKRTGLVTSIQLLADDSRNSPLIRFFTIGCRGETCVQSFTGLVICVCGADAKHDLCHDTSCVGARARMWRGLWGFRSKRFATRAPQPTMQRNHVR